MRYVSVTEQQLNDLRAGLQVLEMLELDETKQLYLYGLTTNAILLDAVKEAIAYWSDDEIAEQDAKVVEAVFVVPASSDTLYYLSGSGLMLRNEEVAYNSGTGEGPKTVSLKHRGLKAPASYFSEMALSADDLWATDFLKQHGSAAVAQAKPQQQVQRTEPAAEAPAPAAAPAAPAAQPAVPTGRENVKASLDVEAFLERHNVRRPR